MDVAVSLGFLSATPGPGEILLVFVVVLVLFGAKRLPEIARTLGKTMEELKRSSRDFRDQLMGSEDGRFQSRGDGDEPSGEEQESSPADDEEVEDLGIEEEPRTSGPDGGTRPPEARKPGATGTGGEEKHGRDLAG